MATHEERRIWPRASHEDQIIIKVVASSSSNLAGGRTIYCRTADVSRQGIRVQLDQELPAGTELELWVIPVQRRGTLVLTGIVKWCKAAQGGQTLWAGVEIRREPTVDFSEWESMVSELVKREEA